MSDESAVNEAPSANVGAATAAAATAIEETPDSDNTDARLSHFDTALKGRGTKRELMLMAQAKLKMERERAELDRHEKMRARAKKERWKEYGPNGKGFVTTHLKGQE